jgi:hypothetical protein
MNFFILIMIKRNIKYFCVYVGWLKLQKPEQNSRKQSSPIYFTSDMHIAKDLGLLREVIVSQGGHWDKISESEEIEYNCVRRLQRFIFLEGGRGGGGWGLS